MKFLKIYLIILLSYSFNSFATKYIAATCPGPLIWGAFDATCPFFSSPGGVRLSFQPATGDVLEIPAGCTVTVNQNFNINNRVTFNIFGTLNFSGTSNKLNFLNSGTVINVYSGGSISAPSNSNQIGIGTGPSEWSGPGTSTGPFTITNGALPIELISFSGICAINGVQLNWSTATEKDNQYFLIEKSTDGIDWKLVTKINGNGTSNVVNEYLYIDQTNLYDVLYYRLTQVDRNGSSEVFQSIDVSCRDNDKNQMILYPNPSSTELNIILSVNKSSSNSVLKIINNIGQSVFESKIDLSKGLNNFVLPIDIASGSYSILLSSDNISIPSQKLIILK